MGITIASGFPTDVTGTGLSSVSLAAGAPDDAVLFLIRNVNASATTAVSSITKSSGTGAVGTFSRVGTAGTYNTGGSFWDWECWIGQITTAGTLTLPIAWTNGTPSATVEVQTFELNSGLGSTVWGGVTGTTVLNGSSSTLSWLTETSDGTHALQAFFGYCDYAVGGTFTGLTSGFSYYNPYNVSVYNLALAQSTGYAPSVTNSASGGWDTAGWIIYAAPTAPSFVAAPPLVVSQAVKRSANWMKRASGLIAPSKGFAVPRLV